MSEGGQRLLAEIVERQFSLSYFRPSSLFQTSQNMRKYKHANKKTVVTKELVFCITLEHPGGGSQIDPP